MPGPNLDSVFSAPLRSNFNSHRVKLELRMSDKYWELILDGALAGETNMAIDGDLLASVQADPEPRTVLRLYSWAAPTISLGRNQKIDRAVDMEFCRAEGLDVVHRPTGGRAVLHDDEVTYAVVSNDPTDFDGGTVYGTYRRISEALAEGYRRLGADVALAPDTRRLGASGNGADYPCFVSPSRYELMVGGRKVAGSAQRRLGRGFLQHGSLPITCNRALLARATRLEDVALLDDEMAGMEECLDRRPTSGEVIGAVVGAFEECFEVSFRRRIQPAGQHL